MSQIEINEQFQQVLDFVNQTNELLFVTGKAGTGKTTLLRHLRSQTFKQHAVVAPTGVAAINAGGSTIHSFFQFPFTPFLPMLSANGDVNLSGTRLPVLKYTSQRLAIFRSLELLIIDEVSMVRADLLDQIDVTLRQTRQKWSQPFGGVQVLLIGDLHQLPPVVQQEEWKLLNEVYPSPFFFDSVVMRKHRPVYIELQKIYRQSEQDFIDLLNKVRHNNMDAKDLDILNSHYRPHLTDEDYQNNITLTTHNRKADEINQRNLDRLKGRSYTYECDVDGTFGEKSYPADQSLTLKAGTRVMFLKNNSEKNYYNGKIGVVSDLDDESVTVMCDDGTETTVGPETWTNVTYKVDKATHHVEEDVLGTFSQVPLRLAWAITIHKSQGLTFDKLIIDAAESFSAGQVYVALSRCRSLKGLTLSSRVPKEALLNDRNVTAFAENKSDEPALKSIFGEARRNYHKQLLLDLFDFGDAMRDKTDLGGLITVQRGRITAEGETWGRELIKSIEDINAVAEKFRQQLTQLMSQQDETAMQDRIKKAVAYFVPLVSSIAENIRAGKLVTESREASQHFNEVLQHLFELFHTRSNLLNACENGFDLDMFVKRKLSLTYPDTRINTYASAKNTKISSTALYPELFRSLLMVRDDICSEEELPVFRVASSKTIQELADYLPTTHDELQMISGFGPAKTEEFGDRFLKVIRNFMESNGVESRMGQLGGNNKKRKKKEKGNVDGHETGKNSASGKPSNMDNTYDLFRKGHSIEEIAKKSGFVVSTIEGHLSKLIASGKVEISEVMSNDVYEQIIETAKRVGKGFKAIKEALPDEITYGQIRMAMSGSTLNNGGAMNDER